MKCSMCGWKENLVECPNCKMVFCSSCIAEHYNACVFSYSNLTGERDEGFKEYLDSSGQTPQNNRGKR